MISGASKLEEFFDGIQYRMPSLVYNKKFQKTNEKINTRQKTLNSVDWWPDNYNWGILRVLLGKKKKRKKKAFKNRFKIGVELANLRWGFRMGIMLLCSMHMEIKISTNLPAEKYAAAPLREWENIDMAIVYYFR